VGLFDAVAIDRSVFPRFAVSGFAEVLSRRALSARVAAFFSVFEALGGWSLAAVDLVSSGLDLLAEVESDLGFGTSKYFSGFLCTDGSESVAGTCRESEFGVDTTSDRWSADAVETYLETDRLPTIKIAAAAATTPAASVTF
jgi:hypothetical protein